MGSMEGSYCETGKVGSTKNLVSEYRNGTALCNMRAMVRLAFSLVVSV